MKLAADILKELEPFNNREYAKTHRPEALQFISKSRNRIAESIESTVGGLLECKSHDLREALESKLLYLQEIDNLLSTLEIIIKKESRE